MEQAYFHSDDVVVSAPARRCYELVLAIRRYPLWCPQVRVEALQPSGTLQVGSRFRVCGGGMTSVVEVVGLQPWRRIDLRYVEGDLLGPVSWEFIQRGSVTLIRHSYRGVQPNNGRARQLLGSGTAARPSMMTLQAEALAGLRRWLEEGHDASGGDLFEALHTLSSVRTFRPDAIPDAAIQQILEAATRAPSARNAQPWCFVVVRATEPKRAVARLYLSAWEHAQIYTAAVDADADIKSGADYGRMMRSVDALARCLHEVPLLVFACLDTRRLGPLADSSGGILSPQSAYASIFPAVQNLMLAARGLGIGSTLTTVFASVEAELREVLDIPPHVHLAALVPLGYPKRPFRTTRRRPVSEVAFLDRWGTRFPSN